MTFYFFAITWGEIVVSLAYLLVIIGMCDPGTYSVSGLQPCIECPTNAYQPMKGETSCLQCESQRRTLSPGATSGAACQGNKKLGTEPTI